MAQRIKHIDKIARDKQRDVLFIRFQKDVFPRHDWEHWAVRNELIVWLDANGFSHEKCAEFADEHGWEGYRGQLYIDVPFDEADEKYQLLSSHLEKQDGTPKFKGIVLYYLPLSEAMKNSHHDKPGFWDKWAEAF